MHAPNRFDPASVGVFRVTDRAFDRDTGAVSLHYALDDRYSFVETITFETPFARGPGLDGPGLERALLHLHIAAGTSYYKTAAPPVVAVEDDGLLPIEHEFHRHLYDDGLREFAVANGLPVPRQVAVRSGPGAGPRPTPPGATRPGGLVVPIGGGKDSMVLIEAVKHLHPRLFAVNPHPLVYDLAALSGLELIVVRRRLDPGLADLNASGAFNGHVPITAIVSLIAVVGSFLYGYDTIAMAVERSASEETALVDGVPVNHQYSKSLEFERALADLVAGVHRSRPLLRIGAPVLLGAGHRPGLCPAHRLPRLVLQLQLGLPPDGGGGGSVVRPLPEVPLRGADAGPVPRP